MVEDKLKALIDINTNSPYWISREDIDRLIKVVHAAIDVDRSFFPSYNKGSINKLRKALEELGEC